MNYIYFDASAGISGDMILGALLDLGVSHSKFIQQMERFNLPVEIQIKETKRASLRGLKVDVSLQRSKQIARKWTDIETLLQGISFPLPVKQKALSIFKKLFEAEAKVHGCSFHEVHLHETGADDALIDIVGSCYLAHILQVKEFYCSPLNLGSGWVKTDHGPLPVPPPAVAEILKHKPVYSAHVERELVTPTGAAIVSTLSKKFIPFPQLCYKKIGYGAGRRNIAHFPNILRVFYGELSSSPEDKTIYIVETNVDDSTPEILANFTQKAFKLGALDVYSTPVFMKKNRIATKLTLLTEIDKIDFIIHELFKETNSIGVRYYPVQRRVLERKRENVNVFGHQINMKVAYLEGKKINVQPEFSDCLKLAQKKKIPVKKILRLALKQYGRD